MKTIKRLLFIVIISVVSCSIAEDDTNDEYTGNCTILNGNFVTYKNK